jgi:putative acetyltransferase
VYLTNNKSQRGTLRRLTLALAPYYKEILPMVNQLLSDPRIRSWAIARILPNAKIYIVARFRNRQDAEDHKRLLHRFIPAAKFEIIFDLPNQEQEDNRTYAADL